MFTCRATSYTQAHADVRGPGWSATAARVGFCRTTKAADTRATASQAMRHALRTAKLCTRLVSWAQRSQQRLGDHQAMLSSWSDIWKPAGLLPLLLAWYCQSPETPVQVYAKVRNRVWENLYQVDAYVSDTIR